MTKAIGSMLLVVALVACDDGDGDSSPTLSSGLPPTSQLDSLSDGDLQKFCDAGEALAKSLLTTDRICTVTAAAFAQDAQMCQQIKAECLKMPPDPDEFMPDEDPDEPSCVETMREQLKDCDATVEELETCQNDGISLALAQFDITCSDVPLPMPEDGEMVELEPPASCKALQERCPGLSDDADDARTGGANLDAGVPDAAG